MLAIAVQLKINATRSFSNVLRNLMGLPFCGVVVPPIRGAFGAMLDAQKADKDARTTGAGPLGPRDGTDAAALPRQSEADRG